MSTDTLTAAEQFFYEYAGWGYVPEKETPEEGRLRGARNLAATEAWAKSVGMVFTWEDDDVPWESDITDDDGTPYVPNTVESCTALIGDSVYASLYGIADADSHYRRVIQAELASEARSTVERNAAHAKLIAPILEDLKAARDKLNAVIGGTLSVPPSVPDPRQYRDAIRTARVGLTNALNALAQYEG